MFHQKKLSQYTIGMTRIIPGGETHVRSKTVVPLKMGNFVRKIVRQQIDKNTEDHVYEVNLTTSYSAISTNWAELLINNVAQGDDITERVGRAIRIKSIRIYGVLAQGSAEAATDDSYNVMRIVLAIWGGGAGTTPLQSSTIRMNNKIHKESSGGQHLERLLLDRYIPLQVTSTEQGAGDGYAPGLKVIKYYKRFKKGLTVHFGDDSASYPDKRIYLSMLSDSSATTHPGFVAGRMELKFEDA